MTLPDSPYPLLVWQETYKGIVRSGGSCWKCSLVWFFSLCGHFPALDIRITDFYQSEDLRRKVNVTPSFIAGGTWSEALMKGVTQKDTYVMMAELYLNSFFFFLIPNLKNFLLYYIVDTIWLLAVYCLFSICDTGTRLILTIENNCSIKINLNVTRHKKDFQKQFPDIFSKCWGIKLTSFLDGRFQSNLNMFVYVHELESEKIGSNGRSWPRSWTIMCISHLPQNTFHRKKKFWKQRIRER